MNISISQLSQQLDQRIAELKKHRPEAQKSRTIIDNALTDGNTYYGINTGFGILANKRVSQEGLEQLQSNLLKSHAVGVGPLIPKEICALMLKLKIHALGLGYSGVSDSTLERLIYFAEHKLIPSAPSKGSLGASGDLAPLAHLFLPLLALGEFWDEKGTATIPAEEILKKHNLEPVILHPKDGLALINGTQFMLAYGVFVLNKCLRLLDYADLIAAMSLEALQGSIKPFDPRIHDIRPHKGQRFVAANVRKLLEESEILESHRNCGKVQDPYCLRCVPQVHGATRDALDYVVNVLETEMNSVTDNPLVFENGDILSGGNFHGQPLALALDFAAIALAELGSISERRTYLLLEGEDGLPTLLMRETGINSGFMIPQYTSAALVSENKVLCHPASVDSIPSSLGQEDHVSMGSISATKLLTVFENLEHILAIELFTAAQALDFRMPLKPGRGVQKAHQYVRKIVPHNETDKLLKEDMNACYEIIRDGKLHDLVFG